MRPRNENVRVFFGVNGIDAYHNNIQINVEIYVMHVVL